MVVVAKEGLGVRGRSRGTVSLGWIRKEVAVAVAVVAVLLTPQKEAKKERPLSRSASPSTSSR